MSGLPHFIIWFLFHEIRLVECGCSSSPVKVRFFWNLPFQMFSLIVIVILKLGNFAPLNKKYIVNFLGVCFIIHKQTKSFQKD